MLQILRLPNRLPAGHFRAALQSDTSTPTRRRPPTTGPRLHHRVQSCGHDTRGSVFGRPGSLRFSGEPTGQSGSGGGGSVWGVEGGTWSMVLLELRTQQSHPITKTPETIQLHSSTILHSGSQDSFRFHQPVGMQVASRVLMKT